METIRYARLGQEDINFGKGTFEVRLADGRVVVLNQVDLGVLLSDAALSTRALTLDSLTVTTLTPTTLAPGTTLRVPEKADPGSPSSGEIWINSGGTVLEYADDQASPVNHALVAADTTQTLTNKTLTSPTISSPTLSGTVIGTYTLGGTPTLGASLALNGNDLTDIDEIALNDAATNPTAAGRLRRSGNELVWRRSTGSMRIFHGEAGTVCCFFQSAAPTGWTTVTTHNDKLLRVVSGTGGGSGGSVGFSTFAADTATDNYTLTTTDTPAHTHTVKHNNDSGGAQSVISAGVNAISNAPFTHTSSSVGGGGAHSHGLSQDIQYIDMILCSKD